MPLLPEPLHWPNWSIFVQVECGLMGLAAMQFWLPWLSLSSGDDMYKTLLPVLWVLRPLETFLKYPLSLRGDAINILFRIKSSTITYSQDLGQPCVCINPPSTEERLLWLDWEKLVSIQYKQKYLEGILMPHQLAKQQCSPDGSFLNDLFQMLHHRPM